MWRAELPQAVDLLALHRQHPRLFPFLLQSVARHPHSGRWDILFAFPEAELSLADGVLRSTQPGLAEAPDFFAALDQWCARETPAARDQLPFCGGWFFYLGYETAQQVEPTLCLPRAPFNLPDALAVRCPAAIVYDRERQCCHAIAERDAAQLDRLLSLARDVAANDVVSVSCDEIVEEAAPRYLAGVERILDYLHAGDVFQVNLSRRWRARLDARCDAVDLYAQLQTRNPAPFAGLMRWGDAAVISSSPERLLQIDGRIAQTRPIAGTRRRGHDAGEDERLRSVLREDLKERAEHVMLLDLERNDLGRVCKPGSIAVDELMTLESYAHVHHIVSNVRGELRDGIGPGAALRAVFPGGTITGCPKVRVMQIIAELEGEGRGPYTGAFGYLSRDGRLDSNILIRSMVWQAGEVSFRAGAGIVADSQPQAELLETRAKARGLLLALNAES
ncbi:aminodeoxychorismate synthase component I [Solimonas terrae]|uniref:Aminodeoxychorismate synthase component I n=1 Tax=Solimonas terrae TaxID=1396819 RepID=A0A6M2BV08_9GAMM|nr:aminodeoxychorismate synthase component I [Solimonas terrae]NGY06318.1 aminodeoxychorismate synthase component I [Solimonas terrae]